VNPAAFKVPQILSRGPLVPEDGGILVVIGEQLVLLLIGSEAKVQPISPGGFEQLCDFLLPGRGYAPITAICERQIVAAEQFLEVLGRERSVAVSRCRT